MAKARFPPSRLKVLKLCHESAKSCFSNRALRWPDSRESIRRFARIDSQIRANRLIFANRVKVPKLNPFFCESRFRGLTIANRRFEAIRANRSHVVKIGFFLRIDSRASIHANCPDSRCKNAGPSKIVLESRQLSRL